MKKTLRLHFLLFALFGFGAAHAQTCVVDPQYTSPGIYPSDTLQDMIETNSANQVIQFVFPVDTVISGFTLPFDSFKVSSVSNIPPGLQWECNQNHPTCLYVSNPPNLTRGCVKVYGAPASSSAAYPAYDSLIVTGTAYVTLFFNVVPISQDIPVYYRVMPLSSTDAISQRLNMQVSPNPVRSRASVSFDLEAATTISLSLFNTLGEEVVTMDQGTMGAGTKQVTLNTSDLPEGVYFLRLDMNGGEHVETKKIVNLR